MADPAWKLEKQPDDVPGNVDSPAPRHLKDVGGGGETSEPDRSWYKSDNQPLSNQQLQDRETEAGTQPNTGQNYLQAVPSPERSFYKAPGTDKGKGPLGKPTAGKWWRSKKSMIGASLIAATITSVVVLFFSLLPLKLLHVVTNIQNHFFAVSENATERMTERLVQGYLKKHVFPALTTCGNTVNKNCRVIVPDGGNPVTHLYRAWANARFEHKLATKYGIEFKYQQSSGKYFVKAPGLQQDIDISDFQRGEVSDLFDSDGFQKSKSSNAFRNTLRQQIRLATDGEFFVKRMFYLHKASRLAKIKTGLPSCVITCTSSTRAKLDNFRDWKKDQKNKAVRFALSQRVIGPRDEMEKLVIKCMFSRSCDLDLKSGAQPDVDQDGKCRAGCLESGKHVTGFENEIRTQILGLPDKYGLDSAAKLATAQKLYDEINAERSIKAYRFKKVVTAAILEVAGGKGNAEVEARAKVAASRLVSSMPLIGLILFAGDIASLYDYVAKNSPQMAHTLNSISMIGKWQTDAVYADEGKEGNIDPAMFGSWHDSFGPGQNSDVGGTAQAEQSPLYLSLIAGKTYGPNEARPPQYKCENGKPVPPPWVVCAEERLDQTTDANQLRTKAKSIPGYELLVHVGDAQNFIFGKLASLVCKIPGIDLLCKGLGFLLSVVGQIAAKAAEFSGLQHFFAELFNEHFLFSNPISPLMSGARAFNMAAAGADLLANELAHYTLGGVKLTAQQVNEIALDQENSRLAEYKNQSLFARLTDTESPYSPAAKLATAVPSTSMDSVNNLAASLFKNPFGKIFGTFNSVFNATPKAFAEGDCSRYVLDKSGNGLYYWDVNIAKVDDHGGSIRASHKEGTYLVFFDQGPGREGQPAGSSDTFTAPDYCDPGGSDPFGVSQYGYQKNNPIFRLDPLLYEQYYEQNCKTNAKTLAYHKRGADNANKLTKQPENPPDPKDPYLGTNPCLLIGSTVGVAGGFVDESLLPDDEVANTSSDGNSVAPDANAQQLAEQILEAASAGRIKFNVLNSADTADGSTPEQNIEQTARGRPANTTRSDCGPRGGVNAPNNNVSLDVDLLKFILELSQDQSIQNIQINALAGQCHSENSNHYKGKAVDFGCPFDATVADRIGRKYNVSKNFENCTQHAHYHYSVGGG